MQPKESGVSQTTGISGIQVPLIRNPDCRSPPQRGIHIDQLPYVGRNIKLKVPLLCSEGETTLTDI